MRNFPFPPPLPWQFNPQSKATSAKPDLDQMLDEKEHELISLGIPPELSKRAVRWAQEYAHGLTAMMDTPASEMAVVYRRALVYGLKKSESWARGILKAIEG